MRKRPELSLRTRALQYLARREYSRAELRGKIFPHLPEDVETGQVQIGELDALLDDLIERGWLSDERAAAQLIEAKRNRFGSKRIAHELRQRGIAEELIDDALPQLKETEFTAAREVWGKKFGKLPVDHKEKAKQIRFLQSRGFSSEVVLKVLRNANLEEMGGIEL